MRMDVFLLKLFPFPHSRYHWKELTREIAQQLLQACCTFHHIQILNLKRGGEDEDFLCSMPSNCFSPPNITYWAKSLHAKDLRLFRPSGAGNPDSPEGFAGRTFADLPYRGGSFPSLLQQQLGWYPAAAVLSPKGPQQYVSLFLHYFAFFSLCLVWTLSFILK